MIFHPLVLGFMNWSTSLLCFSSSFRKVIENSFSFFKNFFFYFSVNSLIIFVSFFLSSFLLSFSEFLIMVGIFFFYNSVFSNLFVFKFDSILNFIKSIFKRFDSETWFFWVVFWLLFQLERLNAFWVKNNKSLQRAFFNFSQLISLFFTKKRPLKKLFRFDFRNFS